MKTVTIRNLMRYPIPLSLRHEHEGVDGRTIYLTPRGEVSVGRSVEQESDVRTRVAAGQIRVTTDGDTGCFSPPVPEPKEEEKEAMDPAPKKKGWRGKRETRED